ncbi:MAG TPA: DUF2961 domain-containing protein [bacterium]|nr:DUF2961 domain-containing protein [bacterium]
MKCALAVVCLVLPFCSPSFAQFDLRQLSELTPGVVRTENSLWPENPIEVRFDSPSEEVVLADLKGPGEITMIHFAMPESSILRPTEYTFGRDLVMQIYWDGEKTPSVDCPVVDFFCDPAGLRDIVNTALVNKCRGFNAYFPMPFRKSARVILRYDGEEPPSWDRWRLLPCYGYVMHRSGIKISSRQGYFHAQFRQQALLLGKEDYVALEAQGRGKFVGWNVTVRRPGTVGYPVDMNEKFFVDGEDTASTEFQGLEDSFGFSYGFPPAENFFPFTGFFPFTNEGAAAYRFFVNDSISFKKSLRVTIGFGVNENPMFRQSFSAWGTSLQFSSVCYWYQTEPHAPFPKMLSAEDRAPAPSQLFWPDQENLPSEDDLRSQSVQLEMWCGRPDPEVIYAEPGYSAQTRQGESWCGWNAPTYHCRSHREELIIDLTVPSQASGIVRVYIKDPDNYMGGRSQRVLVGDKDLGEHSQFGEGRWLEVPVTAEMTSQGIVTVRAMNLNPASNAVISNIQWLRAP